VNARRLCQAFAKVSWAKSSASSGLPDNDRAKTLRMGIKAARSASKSAVSFKTSVDVFVVDASYCNVMSISRFFPSPPSSWCCDSERKLCGAA
jgi:hypothetical protein